LEELDKGRIDGFQEAKVLLPCEPSPWMWELLELVGVPRSRCLQTNGRQLRVEKLCFASRLGQPMNTPLWAIDWIRNRFTSSFRAEHSSSAKRLYLSRRNAPKRRVINEAEVEQTLQEFGFQTVMLEDLSVAGQVRLFSGAEVVVGPHGAGFANVVFARNAKVLEFFEPSWVWPTYYALSHDCGHDYRGLICNTVEGINMKVDVVLLRKVVRELLNATAQ
jgi:capsular polysaccharide biosynthesis protein